MLPGVIPSSDLGANPEANFRHPAGRLGVGEEGVGGGWETSKPYLCLKEACGAVRGHCPSEQKSSRA